MRRHAQHLLMVLLVGPFGACLPSYALARPAQASSIVLVTDAQGHRVYINTGAPEEGLTRTSSNDGAGQLSSAPPRVRKIVRSVASQFRVDPKLVNAVIQVESAYNPLAVSPKGAMGLMQLIPATARRFGVRNPFDPRQNIRGGVTFLRYLLERYNGSVPLSLAAYNAGEHRVERRIPAIPETVAYVHKVTSLYRSSGGAGMVSAPQPGPRIYRFIDGDGVVHFSNN